MTTPPNTDENLRSLLKFCHIRHYPNKAIVIRPGDLGDTLYFIVEGSCAVTMHNKETDQDMIFAYLNRGDFIGEIGVFMGGSVRDVTVRTREPSELAQIGYTRLHQLLNTDLSGQAVGILSALGRQLSMRLLETSRRVRSLALNDVSGRIQQALVELTRQPDAMTHPDGMQIRITRQDLGSIVGCSREMAGRALKSLEQQGKIWAKGKTIVVFGTR